MRRHADAPGADLARRRRLTVISSAVVLAVGALVAVLVLRAEAPVVTRTPIPFVPSVPITDATPSPPDRGDGANSTAAELSPGAPDRTRDIRITVTDAINGRPLPDATVTALPCAQVTDGGDTFTVYQPTLGVRADTDQAGQCLLSANLTRATELSIRAIAPRYCASEVRVPVGALDRVLVVALQQALSLSGRVITRFGSPVPGLPIVAVADELRDGSLAAHRMHNSLAPLLAVSSDDGQFVFDTLQEGVYRFDVHADGWVPTDARIVRGSPGDKDVRLVVDAVRVFRLQVVHGEPACALGLRTLQWDVDGPGLAGGAWTATETRTVSVGPQGSLKLGWSDSEPGVLTGCVVPTQQEADIASARLLIQASGYKDCITSVTLMRPSEAAPGGRFDRLRLLPESPFDVGTVECEYDRPLPSGFWFEPEIVVGVDHPVASTALRGYRTSLNTWSFFGVPTGTSHFYFNDGISNSRCASVEVVANRPTRVRPEWPPVTGVRFVLGLPESPDRVSGARLVVRSISDDGAVGPLLDATRASEVHLTAGGLLYGLRGLAAGRYAYSAVYGDCRAKGEFQLAEGEIKEVRVELSRVH
jgi:hypothetical protein